MITDRTGSSVSQATSWAPSFESSHLHFGKWGKANSSIIYFDTIENEWQGARVSMFST